MRRTFQVFVALLAVCLFSITMGCNASSMSESAAEAGASEEDTGEDSEAGEEEEGAGAADGVGEDDGY